MYRVAVMKKAGHRLLDSWPGLAQDKRFLVEPICVGCAAAMDRLMKIPADLMLVDLRSQSDRGLELIRRLRMKGVGMDIIALVPRNNARVMQRALRLGVIDCLVEPWDGRHMQQALNRFLFRAQLMRTEGRLTQKDIDRVLQGMVQQKGLLPKGIQEKTLMLIRRVFEQRPKRGLSCEEVSAAAGLSRITVQRYLDYLCDKGELVWRMNYHTGGRPSAIYACKSKMDQTDAAAMRQIV